MKLFSVLRVYRAFKGLKLKALAEEIGITPRELSALEDDKSPSGAVLAKIMTWALKEEEEVAKDAGNGSQTTKTEAGS